MRPLIVAEPMLRAPSPDSAPPSNATFSPEGGGGGLTEASLASPGDGVTTAATRVLGGGSLNHASSTAPLASARSTMMRAARGAPLAPAPLREPAPIVGRRLPGREPAAERRDRPALVAVVRLHLGQPLHGELVAHQVCARGAALLDLSPCRLEAEPVAADDQAAGQLQRPDLLDLGLAAAGSEVLGEDLLEGRCVIGPGERHHHDDCERDRISHSASIALAPR